MGNERKYAFHTRLAELCGGVNSNATRFLLSRRFVSALWFNNIPIAWECIIYDAVCSGVRPFWSRASIHAR